MIERKSRILLIGDSLGFARPAHDQLFDQAWPEIVRQHLPKCDVWQRCRPTATVLDVSAEFALFAKFANEFDHFIIQVGITDCCPRPYPFWIQRLLRTYAGSELQRSIGKYYPILLKFRTQPWIPSKLYKSTLCAMIDDISRFNPQALIGMVVIADAGAALVERVNGVQKAIDEYNRVLAEIELRYSDKGKVSLINPFVNKDLRALLLPDGHHLTALGHEVVAQSVIEFLEKSLESPIDIENVSSKFSNILR